MGNASERKIINVLILASIVIIGNSLFWKFFPKDLYYILEAIGWVLFSWVLKKIFHEFLSNENLKLLSEYIYLSTINNLLDEVIFQNIHFSYGEFVIFVLITSLYIYKYVKRTD